ncbi:hypothetical protein [Mangrovibacter phragmitis]|uniref:hypothetical protein n=1 Tax=Mangrovibacter phragmitis TaxID=1691903 RepID=UPI003369F9C0
MFRRRRIELSQHSFREAVLLKFGQQGFSDMSVRKLLVLLHEHFRYMNFKVNGATRDELHKIITNSFFSRISDINEIEERVEYQRNIDDFQRSHTHKLFLDSLVAVRYFIEQMESVRSEMLSISLRSRSPCFRIFSITLDSAKEKYTRVLSNFVTAAVLYVYPELVMPTSTAISILDDFLSNLIRNGLRQPGNRFISIQRSADLVNIPSYMTEEYLFNEANYEYAIHGMTRQRRGQFSEEIEENSRLESYHEVIDRGLYTTRRLSEVEVPPSPPVMRVPPVRTARPHGILPALPVFNLSSLAPAQPDTDAESSLKDRVFLDMAILEVRKEKSSDGILNRGESLIVYKHDDDFYTESECREKSLPLNNPIKINYISDNEYLIEYNRLGEQYRNINLRDYNEYLYSDYG